MYLLCLCSWVQQGEFMAHWVFPPWECSRYEISTQHPDTLARCPGYSPMKKISLQVPCLLNSNQPIAIVLDWLTTWPQRRITGNLFFSAWIPLGGVDFNIKSDVWVNWMELVCGHQRRQNSPCSAVQSNPSQAWGVQHSSVFWLSWRLYSALFTEQVSPTDGT